jgi:ketosteroid isomerase-like protein
VREARPPDEEAAGMASTNIATPALEAFLDEFNAHGDACHWVCGDRGVSEWTLRGTQRTGEPIEVRGCDVFQFVDGKISRKDSFWKIVD